MIIQIVVFRDSDGVVKNIGDWDYMLGETEDSHLFINNPLPESYTSKIEAVVINEDGSRVAVDQ